MEKKQSVIGIGEALFDVLPEGKKLGGAPANFAYHVSQFGLESCAVSAMGDDELGKELEKELNDHHLNYQIDKVAYPTGTVQVSLDANGIPCYDTRKELPGQYPLHPCPGGIGKELHRSLLRFAGSAQRGFPQHHLPLPRQHAEGRRNPQNLRHQSPSGILYQGDDHRKHQAMQHPQDQR